MRRYQSAVLRRDQDHWWRVMCLTGVDYFSSLSYAPGIAFLAAGILSPMATVVLVLLTLFGAVPIYFRVANKSPHGQGSIAMLEKLLPGWSAKLFVLCLLGFAATDFIITITLSAADAATHLVQNPLMQGLYLPVLHHRMALTIFMLALLGAIFLKGFREAIGVAVILVWFYLGLSFVVIATGLYHLATNWVLVRDWWHQLFMVHSSHFAVGTIWPAVGISLLLFPKLALGLSGFETGVAVMPLVKGDPDDSEEFPQGRIRNTKKLLITAAIIMSIFLLTSSIVMVENTLRNLSNKEMQELTKQQIIEKSVAEVARPILYGILIITVVYIPILCLEGIEYKMFSPMVITVCSALLGSLLLSLILVPVLCIFFLKRHTPEKETWLIRSIKPQYTKFLDLALKHKHFTVNTALALLIISLLSLFFIGTEFVPKLDEGDFLLEIKEFPSISLPAALETASQIEKIIKQFPEVKTVVSRLGRPDLATDPMGVYGTDCFIMLRPKNQWPFGITEERLTEDLRKRLTETITGVTLNFTQPIAMRVAELVSGVRSEVAIKIFGEDTDYLQNKAEQIQQLIAKIPGATDLQIERLTGSAQIEIIPDRIKMARYGINISDIRTILQTAVIGKVETQVIQGRKRFDVRVQFPRGSSLEPADVGSLLIQSANNKLVPLSQVAEVRIAQTLETINREFGQRRIVVQCNVRNRDLGSFVKDCQQKIKNSIQLDKGFRIVWGGQFENQQRAMAKFLFVVPLSILIIFILLILAFHSARQALLVLLNVPFALIGGIFALWIRGMYLSVPASIGFIALFGVAVLNGLVLVSHINKLIEQGLPLNTAIRQGSQDRLRPVLMTALVAALGFLPMALSQGAGAEIQKPLATVVIGGLCTSTLLTLLVLPVVYEWFFTRRKSEIIQ